MPMAQDGDVQLLEHGLHKLSVNDQAQPEDKAASTEDEKAGKVSYVPIEDYPGAYIEIKTASPKKEGQRSDGEESGSDEDDVYVAKGPMRQSQDNPDPFGAKRAAAPYTTKRRDPAPAAAGHQSNVASSSAPYTLTTDPLGEFLDDIYPELDLDPSLNLPQEQSVNNCGGIPGLPEPKSGGVNTLLMSSIDDIFCSNEANSGSKIIVKNLEEKKEHSLLPTPLSFDIDPYRRRMGIRIPRTVLPGGAVTAVEAQSGKIEIFIQMDPVMTRVIKVLAELGQVSEPSEYWVIKSQYLRLEPFSGCTGLDAILDGVTAEHLESAAGLVASKTLTDLTKHYANDFTILWPLLCKPETPDLKAQILMVVKKLLENTNPSVRNVVSYRNALGSALDIAAFNNNAATTMFLSEIFYIMGENLNFAPEMGNTLLHLLSRMGDKVADTIAALLSLRHKFGDRHVYNSSLRNCKGELPIHIAAKNEDKCHLKVIQILSEDLPSCHQAKTKTGCLPIHYACQYGRDPTLLTTLLYYDKSVVNKPRNDGFTPLLLLASRSDIHNPAVPIISLEEENQIRMIRALLDHGADRTIDVQGHYPVNLVKETRPKAKLLLKLKRGEQAGNSRQSSPSSGSPPNNFTPQDGMYPGGSNNLDDFHNMARPGPNGCTTFVNNLGSASCSLPSPGNASSVFGDDMSPATNMSSSSGSPPNQHRHMYANSNSPHSVGSQGLGSVLDSGSDSEDGNNLDAIAAVLYQHPVIQDALNGPLSDVVSSLQSDMNHQRN